MATSSLTLYKDATVSEVFNYASLEGKTLTYQGAGSTPALPIELALTRDAKAVGNMSNDRFYVNVHRSGTATARAAVATSGAQLQITVSKDPISGATLQTEAEYALCELVSYVTGAAPTATAVTRIAKLCRGEWL